MEKAISNKELVSVSSLSPESRYNYCIKWIVDSEKIWSLKTADGWALSIDNFGNEVIPIWPYQEFAQICATGAWEGNYPCEIDLSIWLDKWVPGMEHDGRKVGVFPIPDGQNVVVTPRKIEADILRELELY